MSVHAFNLPIVHPVHSIEYIPLLCVFIELKPLHHISAIRDQAHTHIARVYVSFPQKLLHKLTHILDMKAQSKNESENTTCEIMSTHVRSCQHM